MTKKIPALYFMLIISALIVAAVGAYLKYTVLAPLDLYQDEKLAAIPFLLMADEQTKYALKAQNTGEEVVEATEVMVTESVPATEAVTEPIAEAVTEPIEETGEPTEAATEPVKLDESWFDDALFIGDSRTQGLRAYGNMGEADFFTQVGLSVYGAKSARIYVNGVGKHSLKSLLMKKDYGKIYICLGLNEIMGNHDNLIAMYQEIIDLIQEIEPDAVIVLQAIMTVGREKAAVRECFTPEYIAGLNERIKALAVGDKMRFIDVNEWIADEEGYLPEGWSKDGTHPYADGYAQWGQWLLENAATLGID